MEDLEKRGFVRPFSEKLFGVKIIVFLQLIRKKLGLKIRFQLFILFLYYIYLESPSIVSCRRNKSFTLKAKLKSFNSI